MINGGIQDGVPTVSEGFQKAFQAGVDRDLDLLVKKSPWPLRMSFSKPVCVYSSLPRMLPQSLYQSGQARLCCSNKQPPKLSGLKEQRLNHHSCCTSIKGHQGLHSGSDMGTQASRNSHQPYLLPDATP